MTEQQQEQPDSSCMTQAVVVESDSVIPAYGIPLDGGVTTYEQGHKYIRISRWTDQGMEIIHAYDVRRQGQEA